MRIRFDFGSLTLDAELLDTPTAKAIAAVLPISGSALTWVYTTYREDPQYQYALDGYGRAVLQTYYVKIPIGQLIVAFSNGAVVSVEQHKTDPNSPSLQNN